MRMTEKELDFLCERVRENTGVNFHIHHELGRYCVQEISNDGRWLVLSHSPYGTKQEMADWLRAFWAGFERSRQYAKQ